MKVLILGIGRSGTSSLMNGIAEQFDVRVSEPFYHRPIFKEFKEFKWPLKVLEDKGNVVIKCLINQTPLHLNVNTDEEMQGFYVDWSKEFDKVILLSRKNIQEHWESWLNLMYRFYQVHKEPWPGDRTKEPKFVKNSHDKWHWETIPQDFIDLQSPIRYKFDQHHESIKVISEQLNIPITYYEDLYGEDRIESFEIINKWELDLDPFELNDYLHPRSKYRQYGNRNAI